MASRGGTTDKAFIAAYLKHRIETSPIFSGEKDSVRIYFPRSNGHFDVRINPENREQGLVLLVEEVVNRELLATLGSQLFSKNPLELWLPTNDFEKRKVSNVTLNDGDVAYARINMHASAQETLRIIAERDPKGLAAAREAAALGVA